MMSLFAKILMTDTRNAWLAGSALWSFGGHVVR